MAIVVGSLHVPVEAIVDTGGERTLASSSFFRKFPQALLKTGHDIRLQSASNHSIPILGFMNATLKMGEANILHNILIVEVPTLFFILGNDILSRYCTITGSELIISRHGLSCTRLPIHYSLINIAGFLIHDVHLNSDTSLKLFVKLKVYQESPKDAYSMQDPQFLHDIVIASGEFPLFHVLELSTVIQRSPVAPSLFVAEITLVNHSAEPLFIPAYSVVAHFTHTKSKVVNPDTFEPQSFFSYDHPGLRSLLGQTPIEYRTTYDDSDVEQTLFVLNVEDDDVILHGSPEGHLPLPMGVGPKEVYPSHFSTFESQHISPKNLRQLLDLVSQFSDIVAKDSFDIGSCSLVKLSIDTGSSRPTFEKVRQVRQHHVKAVEQILADLQQSNIIRPCSSPYGTNIVIVPKPDDSIRICVDYRKLNAITIHNSQHPIPPIEDHLHKLRDAKFKSKLDLTQAYYSIPVAGESQLKTAFFALGKQYCYNRTPFGLKEAPSMWNFLMATILDGCQDFCIWYFDDLTIFSSSLEDHFRHLKTVFSRLRWGGQKVKMAKCQFLLGITQPMPWLGFIITGNRVSADPVKLDAVMQLPIPNNVKQLQHFLGVASALRKFIDKFSDITAPLYHAISVANKNKGNVVWSADQQNAFDLLKEKMQSPPCLALPDPSNHFFVTTDSSVSAIGAVLSQINDDIEQPVSFASRKFTDNEAKHFSSPEKELYGILFGLTAFKYLLRPDNFTIRTDAKGFVFLKKFSDSNQRINKLKILIFDHSFKIEHSTAKSKPNIMQLTDLLSRSYLDTSKPLRTSYKQLRDPKLNDLQLPASLVQEFPMSLHALWAKLDDFPLTPDKLSGTQNWLWEVATESFFPSTEIISLIHSPKPQNPICNILLTAATSPLFSLETFKDAQNLDQFCSSVLINIKRKKREFLSRFTVKQGLLFRKPSENSSSPRLVVPDSLVTPLIEFYHAGPSAIHTRTESLLRNLKQHFVWKNMESSIKEVVQKCSICHLVNPSNTKVSMGRLPQPKKPQDIVHIDLVGPFPRSACNNRYVLTIVDAFSKFVVFLPIPSKEAHVVAQAFSAHYVGIFGSPTLVHSDQGGEFCNNIFGILKTILGFKMSSTPSFSPQSNGSCERQNQSLLRGLRTLVDGTSKSYWDVYPSFVAAALNNIKRENLISPAEIMLGSTYHPQAFFPLVDPTIRNIKASDTQLDYLKQVCKAQRIAFQIIKNAQPPDNKEILHKFQVGQFILVRNRARQAEVGLSKLAKKWVGPFLVIKVYPNAVLAQALSSSLAVAGATRIFHPRNIKMFHAPSIPIQRQKDECFSARNFLRSLGLPLCPLPEFSSNSSSQSSFPSSSLIQLTDALFPLGDSSPPPLYTPGPSFSPSAQPSPQTDRKTNFQPSRVPSPLLSSPEKSNKDDSQNKDFSGEWDHTGDVETELKEDEAGLPTAGASGPVLPQELGGQEGPSRVVDDIHGAPAAESTPVVAAQKVKIPATIVDELLDNKDPSYVPPQQQSPPTQVRSRGRGLRNFIPPHMGDLSSSSPEESFSEPNATSVQPPSDPAAGEKSQQPQDAATASSAAEVVVLSPNVSTSEYLTPTTNPLTTTTSMPPTCLPEPLLPMATVSHSTTVQSEMHQTPSTTFTGTSSTAVSQQAAGTATGPLPSISVNKTAVPTLHQPPQQSRQQPSAPAGPVPSGSYDLRQADFLGSKVVDNNIPSGLGIGRTPPPVAPAVLHDRLRDLQQQQQQKTLETNPDNNSKTS